MKIIEYIVISANDNDALAEKVNDSIKLGWQPLGGLCFQREGADDGDLYSGVEWYFQQSMVKYENS